MAEKISDRYTRPLGTQLYNPISWIEELLLGIAPSTNKMFNIGPSSISLNITYKEFRDFCENFSKEYPIFSMTDPNLSQGLFLLELSQEELNIEKLVEKCLKKKSDRIMFEGFPVEEALTALYNRDYKKNEEDYKRLIKKYRNTKNHLRWLCLSQMYSREKQKVNNKKSARGWYSINPEYRECNFSLIGAESIIKNTREFFKPKLTKNI